MDKGDVLGQDAGEHRQEDQEYLEEVAGGWRTGGSPAEVVILV